MNKLIALAGMLAVFGSATAGPLGLDFGAPLSSMGSLKLKQGGQPYVYTAPSLPRGNAAFDDYHLVITPANGLCKISAWASRVPTNSYGEGLRRQFEQLKDALSAKYGSPTVYDFLNAGSIWHEPREFMTALTKDERHLSAFWSSDNLALPDKIGTIELKAVGLRDDAGMIALSYTSKDVEKCVAWISAQRNSTL